MGFHVVGDQLLDANGVPFALRGINHPHAWFPERLREAIPAIAATGANSVRVVLSTGARWNETPPGEIREIQRLCRAHGMISVLEPHDCTGFGEEPAASPLSEAVDWWLRPSVREALSGQETWTLVNIANEPFGNGVSADRYVGEHAEAIRRLREGGYRHTLMVDAPNWGQDHERIMPARASDILAADSDRNVVFSVHMYEHYGTHEKVRSYLDAFRGRFPLVVGEFAADHGPRGDVDEQAILTLTRRNGQGCMGWSWKGNDPPAESLDVAETWDGKLTPWGRVLVDGPDGLGASSMKASVLD